MQEKDVYLESATKWFLVPGYPNKIMWYWRSPGYTLLDASILLRLFA